MKNVLRQLSSFIAPILFCIVIPYLIVNAKQHRSGLSVLNLSIFLVILGAVVCLVGLVVFILAVRMLIFIGNGTIMPWDPTRKLVTASLYGKKRSTLDTALETMAARLRKI